MESLIFSTPTYRSAMYRAMRNASEIAGANVKATFTHQIDSLIKTTSQASIERGISGGAKGVVDSVDWAGFESNLRGEYEQRLARAMKEGSKEFQKTFKYKFDPDSPVMKRAIKQRAKELSHKLTMETKKGFRQATKGLFKEGISRRKTAKELKDLIGLTRREAQSVVNMRRGLIDKGFSQGDIDKRTNPLVQKYRKQRATRIARTAGTDVASAGQNAILKDAVASGDVDKGKVEKVWVISMGACPICEPMAGQVRKVDETFTTGEGDQVDGPTVHPNCYCSVIMRIKK